MVSYSIGIYDLGDGCQLSLVRSLPNVNDTADLDQLPASGLDINFVGHGVDCYLRISGRREESAWAANLKLLRLLCNRQQEVASPSSAKFSESATVKICGRLCEELHFLEVLATRRQFSLSRNTN